jgi:hypothetical protein
MNVPWGVEDAFIVPIRAASVFSRALRDVSFHVEADRGRFGSAA